MTADKKFTEKEKWAIAYGIILVGRRFAKERNQDETAAQAFTAVYEHVNFKKEGGVGKCGK